MSSGARAGAARAVLAARSPWLLTVAMLAVAGGAWLAGWPVSDHVRFSGPLFAVVLLWYLLAHQPRSQLTIEVRRHTVGLMWTDLPLVVGLFLLPSWAVLLAATLGRLSAHLRPGASVQRLMFNASVTVLNVTVVAGILNRSPVRAVTHPLTWAMVYLAVIVGALVAAAAVLAVIALVQGTPDPRTVATTALAGVTAGISSTTIALVLLLTVQVTPWSAILLVLIGAVFVFVYRSYARSVRERKSLAELYEFTRAVGTAREQSGLADTVLERTRAFLRAETASLWLPAGGTYPEVWLTCRVDEGVVDSPAQHRADPIRLRALREGQTVLVGRRTTDDPLGRQALRQRGVDEVICTPLRSGSAVVGVLEVANRLGELSAFAAEDARLLQTLAAHAGVAVENSRLLDRLRHDAYHDALTGLPNRRRFAAAVDEAVAVRPVPGEIVAVILLDLDAFKDVNDTLGHLAGDRLLVEVGNRVRAVAPAGALVARMGGDEFAVLIRLSGIGAAHEEAVRLHDALEVPVDIEGMSVDARASVGVAAYPDHAVDGSTLLQRAELAMYAAKTAVRRVQTYLPTMDSLSLRRLSLVSELRRAIEEHQLQVFYQPKVSPAEQEFVGVEALVRWNHPQHGVINPDDFVPVAEHTGLIGLLTTYVLETALRQCRDWLDDGRRLHVAVNLSVRSLVDPDFPDQVDQLLRETAVPPGMLTLEITESGVMSDIDRALPTLHRLRDLGLRLSVDDFGTGHSSLTYLRRLPVNEVKIDKTFVLNMATDSGDLAIVRAIVDLGRHLGLTVVAEGVESEVAYTLLREMHCDLVQGFLLSRPVPYERLETWIQARTELAPSASGSGPRLRVVGS